MQSVAVGVEANLPKKQICRQTHTLDHGSQQASSKPAAAAPLHIILLPVITHGLLVVTTRTLMLAMLSGWSPPYTASSCRTLMPMVAKPCKMGCG